jgi:hypothetical protein
MTTMVDPLALAKVLWPGVVLYDKQREVIYSVWNNDETVVPAGNKLGKDFVAGMTVLLFFLTRNPCRIVTTSATDTHMDILWGEIERFIGNSTIPLRRGRGGPLILNHHLLRRIRTNDGMPVVGEHRRSRSAQGTGSDQTVDPFSFVRGVVTRPGHGESMQGSHAGDDPFSVYEKLMGRRRNDGDWERLGSVGEVPRTLFVCDEASGVEDKVFMMARTWADRMLIIGNTWPCNNYFYWAVEGNDSTGEVGGDILVEDAGH